MRKGLIIGFVLLISLLGFGCSNASGRRVEVSFDNINMVEDIYTDAEKEFYKFLGETVNDTETEVLQEETDNGLNLEEKVVALSEVKVIGDYTRNSESVKCRITAPDMYGYIMENQDNLMTMSEEELYNVLFEQLPKLGKRSVEVEIPASFYEEKLVVDTGSITYMDAVSGGMYSALSEIYQKMLEAIGQEGE